MSSSVVPCLFIGLVWIVAGVEASTGIKETRKENSNVREFCRWEVLNASCPHNSVVLMKSAQYGRMRASRCTELEYYVGCSYDALQELDLYCSGRRRCEVAVPIPELHELQPCPKDLQTYLEADFTCIPVQSGHTCTPKKSIKIEISDEGFLSSHVTDESSQGSRSCPWQLVAAKGQRINLTLFDFNLAQKHNTDQKHSRALTPSSSGVDSANCVMYGVIKEADQKEQTICARSGRMTRVYSSSSNVVDVTFVKQNKDESSFRFLIKYEVTGCPDLETPPLTFSIMERRTDRLTISCGSNEQQLISHLTCHNRRWVGDIRNCTETSSLNGVSDFFTDSDIYTHGLIVSIVTGILLGVIVGACLLFAVLAYRKKRHYRAHQHANNKRAVDFQVEKNEKQSTMRYSDQQIRKVSLDDLCERNAPSDLDRCSFRTPHNKQATPLYVRHAGQQQACDFFQHHHHHHLNDLRAPCKVACPDEHKAGSKCPSGDLKLTDYGFVSDGGGADKECDLEGCFQTLKRTHHCHNALLSSNHHYDTPNFQKNFMPFDIIEN